MVRQNENSVECNDNVNNRKKKKKKKKKKKINLDD